MEIGDYCLLDGCIYVRISSITEQLIEFIDIDGITRAIKNSNVPLDRLTVLSYLQLSYLQDLQTTTENRLEFFNKAIDHLLSQVDSSNGKEK